MDKSRTAPVSSRRLSTNSTNSTNSNNTIKNYVLLQINYCVEGLQKRCI